MRKMKALLVAALSLTAVGFVAPKTSVAVSADTRDFYCTYSAREKDTEYMAYGSSAINTYTAEEAAAAGIPAGYENEVFEIVKGNEVSCGVFLDFEQEQIPVSIVESLQFRVYIVPHASNTGSRPQVRIAIPDDVDNWVYQPGSTPTPAGEWTMVTVAYDSKFEHISKDGMLDKFELGVRMNAYSPVYVDSISYVLKANDGVGPEITCAETVAVGLGEALEFTATAFDTQENRNMDVEYVWEEGIILNANGTPNAVGTYTLTVKSQDFYGNVSTKDVTVKVLEADNVAPTINLAFDTVKATVGAKPLLDVTATDDSDSVTLTESWSEGALDPRGRLTAGTHTWTITAKDTFNNVTTKVVTFIVTEEEPQYSFVTNEENLGKKHTVTFDGVNAVEVSHGFTVDRPADPVREDTAAERYTFIGWYYGEEEWNFDNAITEDMDIQSKWAAEAQVYRVTFDGVYNGLKLEYGENIPENKIPADPQKSMDERYIYTFAGWYNGEELWNFETSVITGETNLTPRFDKEDRLYIVTFDGKNAQEVKYGDKLTEPTPPESADGSIFEGWYSGVTKWDFDTHTVRSNLDLVSQWKDIAILPPTSEDSQDSSEDKDSADTSAGASDTASDTSDKKPFDVKAILSGCVGSVSGFTGIVTVLGAAAVLLKKKED